MREEGDGEAMAKLIMMARVGLELAQVMVRRVKAKARQNSLGYYDT